MKEETLENSINTSEVPSVNISFVEGYPLYPFFKRIYDEYVSEMNAGVDYLVNTNIPVGKDMVSQEWMLSFTFVY